MPSPGARCPYCLDALGGDQERVVRCSTCRTPHHSACFEENGGCVSFGCPGTVSADAGRSVFLPRATLELRPWKSVLFEGRNGLVRMRSLLQEPRQEPVAANALRMALLIERPKLVAAETLKARLSLSLPHEIAVRRLELRMRLPESRRFARAVLLGLPHRGVRSVFGAFLLPFKKIGPGLVAYELEVPTLFGGPVAERVGQRVILDVVLERPRLPNVTTRGIEVIQLPSATTVEDEPLLAQQAGADPVDAGTPRPTRGQALLDSELRARLGRALPQERPPAGQAPASPPGRGGGPPGLAGPGELVAAAPRVAVAPGAPARAGSERWPVLSQGEPGGEDELVVPVFKNRGTARARPLAGPPALAPADVRQAAGPEPVLAPPEPPEVVRVPDQGVAPEGRPVKVVVRPRPAATDWTLIRLQDKNQGTSARIVRVREARANERSAALNPGSLVVSVPGVLPPDSVALDGRVDGPATDVETVELGVTWRLVDAGEKGGSVASCGFPIVETGTVVRRGVSAGPAQLPIFFLVPLDPSLVEAARRAGPDRRLVVSVSALAVVAGGLVLRSAEQNVVVER